MKRSPVLVLMILIGILLFYSLGTDSDEQRVLNVFNELEELTLLTTKEHPFEVLRISREIGELFDSSAKLEVHRLDDQPIKIFTRGKLEDHIRAIRAQLRFFKLEIRKIEVKVKGRGATVDGELRARWIKSGAEKGFYKISDFGAELAEIEGSWLVTSLKYKDEEPDPDLDY